MSAASFDFALAIGGAAGQGIATPGNILARLFVRRGLHLQAYNAFQSIVRGGHIFLTVRISDQQLMSHGDRLDLLVCLNQDTMDRHLSLMGAGTRVIFNSDTITPGAAGDGVGNVRRADDRESGADGNHVGSQLAVDHHGVDVKIRIAVSRWCNRLVDGASAAEAVFDTNSGVAKFYPGHLLFSVG